jgi:hypothetical protein
MKLLLSMAVLVATCSAALPQGTSEAILGYTDNFSAFIDTTAGWTFQTTQNLSVSELGCFAKVFNDNPTVTSIQVGLWDNSGLLLASTTITPASELRDLTRYEAVIPVSLAPGQTYHLGVYYSGGGIGLDVAGAVAGGSVSTAAEIQLAATALASTGFAFPAEQAGTAGSIYAGPNFRFLSQPLLNIQFSPANQVRLSWPNAYPGYTLQSELGLPGSWANSGLSVTTVSNDFVAFDTIGAVPKYYRLSK